MKVRFIFVPQWGGEADYNLFADLPSLPNPWDYISINYNNSPSGTSDFIVKRLWWSIDGGDWSDWKSKEISIECYFALSGYSSDEHKASYEMYKSRKWIELEFDETAY